MEVMQAIPQALPSCRMIRNKVIQGGACVGIFLSPLLSGAQTWEVFDMVTAGFPSNTVRALSPDSSGNMWVGTDWGLCRFDGTDWTVYQTGNSGLPENDIRSLAVAPNGDLWIGTALYGLVVHDGTNWEVFSTQNSPLPDDQINCITFDHRGWAWIGTVGGLVCHTGTEWRVYNDQSTSYNGLVLNGNHIRDVAVAPDGLVAFGTINGGFHYLTDTAVQVHATYIDMFPDNTQYGVLIDTLANERWLACPAGGLLRQGGAWNGGPWFQYTTFNSQIPSNALTCIVQDGFSRLWIGSQLNGLILREPNGDYSLFNTGTSGIPDNSVERLCFAPDGSLWVATFFGGAARFTFDVGIHGESQFDRSLHVFPNPTDGPVRVATEGLAAGSEWRVMDAVGRVLRSGRTDAAQLTFDIRGSAPGLYGLVIGDPDGPRSAWFQLY